ncbi:RNA polymerase sigma factor FliA [Hydrogenophaga borbori]|nr:RNA polymerase sigma factor FliA [Hydrogenophaga borbori]
MNSLAAAESSAAAEQRWLVEHTPLVRRAVAQLASQAGGAMDRDDMLQIGLMGLLEALRRYGEPDERFPGYAAQRVRGAILDELRRQDWRPRSVRQEGHRLRDGIRELRRRLGHEPSEAEVMQHLGVSAEDYLAYEQHTNAETLACFDEVIEELMLTPSAARTPEAELIQRRSLEQALACLNPKEQHVVQLYYEAELSLKEIGAVMGLTEARVCQINKSALQKLRGALSPD